MPQVKATLATPKRALELGALFIENDLGRMREQIQRNEAAQVNHDLNRSDIDTPRPYATPTTTSHEGDFLKATEWASAAAWLRALAERED